MSNPTPVVSSVGAEMYRLATREERRKALATPAQMWEPSFKLILTPERFEALRAMALVNIAVEK